MKKTCLFKGVEKQQKIKTSLFGYLKPNIKIMGNGYKIMGNTHRQQIMGKIMGKGGVIVTPLPITHYCPEQPIFYIHNFTHYFCIHFITLSKQFRRGFC